MYKEFKELSRADAVHACYQDMAARHRARARSIQVCHPSNAMCLSDEGRQILRVVELAKTADIRRANIKQLVQPRLRFPLPHRLEKSRGRFAAKRPSTFY
jgi:large subunit ribosomal protein L18Ae